MSDPDADEATAGYFREHSVPQLMPLIRHGAFLIAAGDDYSDVFSGLIRDAMRLGAWQLSPVWGDALNQWLHRALSDEIAKREPSVERSMSDLDAELSADPISYYERLAASCSNPDAMRWVFAARCKPYRDYLLAEHDAAGTSLRARREKRVAQRQATRVRRSELYAD